MVGFDFGLSNLPAQLSHSTSYVAEVRDWIKCGEKRNKLKFISKYVAEKERTYIDNLNKRQSRLREILGEDTTFQDRELEILTEFRKQIERTEMAEKEERRKRDEEDKVQEIIAQKKEIMSVERCPRYRIAFL